MAPDDPGKGLGLIYTIRDTSDETRIQNRYRELVERERSRAENLERCVQERTEELNRARIAAEEATRAKSDFLASMSHEIRTPMNGIMGVIGYLLEEDLSPSVRESMRLVDASAKSMLALLSDTLDFCKIEAGFFQLERVTFDLRAILDEVTGLGKISCRTKGLEFHTRIHEDTPCDLIGDPVRLRQILSNLVNNAIKFTAAGEVSVRVEPIGLALEDQRVMIEFVVRDSGIGIKEDQLERIFQRFTQAESSTARRFGGTGLGLAISRELARLMGGDIVAQSALGKGAEFRVRIPFEKARAVERVQDVARPKRFDGRHILVVDDNKVNQIVATRLLSRLGCTTDVAENGLLALEKLTNGDFHLVLMDCHMPEIDGFETTRRIRASGQPWAKIPVIAMTANVQSETRLGCMQSGMNGYISKPVIRSALESAIGECLPASFSTET